MSSKQELTAARLKELFKYDSDKGVFTRLVRTSTSTQIGEVAGSKNSNGYVEIKIGRAIFKAHRLAWLYLYGDWPTADVDHINGKRDDNSAANLRSVTRAVNMQNQRGPRTNNNSGFLGVSRNKNKWKAAIKVDGARYYLGNFSTPELAHAAYIDAKRELHEGNTL